MRDEELYKRAAEIHNSQPIEIRKLMCISSANTQINTLETLKRDIMDDAKKRCAEINKWIKNIEDTSNGLRGYVAEYEKTSQVNHE